MQKIIMMLLIFGITNSYAQSRGEPTKSLSIEEANKLNGVANPTINGIPYSQYKAQQNALKQKQVAENKTNAVQDAVVYTPSSVPAYVQPVVEVKKPVEVTATPIPANNNKLVALTPENMKNLGKGPEAPVTSTSAAKPVETTDAAPAKRVMLTPMTSAANTVTENAAAPETSSSKMPEVKLNSEAAKAEPEVPASVAPKAIKIPATPKQGGN